MLIKTYKTVCLTLKIANLRTSFKTNFYVLFKMSVLKQKLALNPHLKIRVLVTTKILDNFNKHFLVFFFNKMISYF